MTPERIKQLVAAVLGWPIDERRDWRRLLDSSPGEAVLLAELAFELDAQPVYAPEDKPLDETSPLRWAPKHPPSGRQIPVAAAELRDRLRGAVA